MTNAARKVGGSKYREKPTRDRETHKPKKRKSRANGAQKGPQQKETEGTQNFPCRRKEQQVSNFIPFRTV